MSGKSPALVVDETLAEIAHLRAANADLLAACQAFLDRFDNGSRADTDYVAGLMRAAITKASLS